MLLKYWPYSSDLQEDGARVWRAHPAGGSLLARIDKCRLASMAGDMRRTVYARGEADTFFSIPAVCMLYGCRVKGYITSEEGNLVFHHCYY